MTPRLLHVGRLAPEKNTEEVIRAFALLKRELPLARLTVVGDGPVLLDLKREASELGVADSIDFTGYKPRSMHRQTRKNLSENQTVIIRRIPCRGKAPTRNVPMFTVLY